MLDMGSPRRSSDYLVLTKGETRPEADILHAVLGSDGVANGVNVKFG